MRTFVFDDGSSNKFWNIDLQGSSFTVNFGKVGTKGQTQTKSFANAAAALKAHDKLVAEKVGKGYVETTVAPVASPLQRSMEDSLVENPDELATHSAYADYLMEQNDPRGEFVQVQLSLDDATRSAADRKKLQQRETELLGQHARLWMGGLGRFLVGDWSGPDKSFHYEFHHGWLDVLRILPAPEALFPILAQAPELRLLRRLEIVYDMRYHPFEFDAVLEGPNAALTEDESPSELYESADILPPLLASPYLTNLRAFKFGFSDNQEEPHYSTMISIFEGCNAQRLIQLLAKCPRIEELYLNTDLPGIEKFFALPTLQNLRILQYYYGTDQYRGERGYLLTALANNKSLTELHTLRLHPGRETNIPVAEVDALVRSPNLPRLVHLQVRMIDPSDEGARRIVDSGILRRLKTLDIGYGDLTDAGARILAASPDLRALQSLNVSRNHLTEEGIAVLRATGVQVLADNQGTGGDDDYDDDNYYDVDVE